MKFCCIYHFSCPLWNGMIMKVYSIHHVGVHVSLCTTQHLYCSTFAVEQCHTSSSGSIQWSPLCQEVSITISASTLFPLLPLSPSPSPASPQCTQLYLTAVTACHWLPPSQQSYCTSVYCSAPSVYRHLCAADGEESAGRGWQLFC